MSALDDATEHSLSEGGEDPSQVARRRLVATVARASELIRAYLWDEAVDEYGYEGAARIWEEARTYQDASGS